MQADGISPINVVQNLIAHLSDRMEVIQKLPWLNKKPFPPAFQNELIVQTRGFIDELLAELSHFGDGGADPDRSSDFYNITRELGSESLPNQTDRQLVLFNNMEAALKQYYDQMIDLKALPDSLQKLIEIHKGKLLHTNKR